MNRPVTHGVGEGATCRVWCECLPAGEMYCSGESDGSVRYRITLERAGELIGRVRDEYVS